MFLPVGGNGPQPWLAQLHTLGKAAFFLFDRELPPETESRQHAIAQFNGVAHRKAFLTSKRSLENYLHTDAVAEACGVKVEISDNDSVAEAVAQKMLIAKRYQVSWAALSYRTRKRLRERAKHLLNRDAVDQMTPERLAQRDPAGEVQAWLRTIRDLIAKPR